MTAPCRVTLSQLADDYEPVREALRRGQQVVVVDENGKPAMFIGCADPDPFAGMEEPCCFCTEYGHDVEDCPELENLPPAPPRSGPCEWLK